MNNILRGLRDLEGVHGTFVADGSGQILECDAETIYDLPLLEQVSRATVTALDSVKLLHEDWDSLTAQFADGKLLVRNLTGAKGKNSGLTLSVIADARLNPSFATVAIRVAVSKIKALFEAAGGLPLPLTPSTLGKQTASAPGSPAVRNGLSGSTATAGFASPPTKAQVAEVATSGLSWSGFGATSSMSASEVAVSDTASSAALTTCTKALAKSVGPMAKFFVKEAVRKLFSERPFSKDQMAVLVAELEKNIEDPADAAKFRQSVMKP